MPEHLEQALDLRLRRRTLGRSQGLIVRRCEERRKEENTCCSAQRSAAVVSLYFSSDRIGRLEYAPENKR